MREHIIKTTNNFTKKYGQIICNKGDQAKEVIDLLVANGYIAMDVCQKKSKAMIKYIKR